MTHRHVLACLIACISGVACGGDDDGGGSPRVTTGLPPSQKFSEFDEADARKACDGLADAFADLLSESELERIACTAHAVGQSVSMSGQADVAGCKAMLAACMNGEDIGQDQGELDFGPAQADCDDVEVSAEFEACDATVGEYERCVSGYASAFKSRLNSLTCDALEDPEKLQETLSQNVDPEDLPECEAFSSKCSDIELF